MRGERRARSPGRRGGRSASRSDRPDGRSKKEAAAYLADRTYFFKVYSYRALFEKRVGGPRDGQYVNLYFGHLKLLASLDRTLRYALLPLTLDVEHFARTKLVREAMTCEGGDGCTLVADYMAHLNHAERRRREGEVRALAPDVYCGNLVGKYALPDGMPLWALLELASFGTFIDLYLFCAERWGDREMRDGHYFLRQAKAVRNVCAHSSNILNGLARQDGAVATNASVSTALAKAGLSRRVRASKMRNPRLQQIATLLHLRSQIVPEGTAKGCARMGVAHLKGEMGGGRIGGPFRQRCRPLVLRVSHGAVLQMVLMPHNGGR